MPLGACTCKGHRLKRIEQRLQFRLGLPLEHRDHPGSKGFLGLFRPEQKGAAQPICPLKKRHNQVSIEF